MKLAEQIAYLKEHHFDAWLEKRTEVEQDMSAKQGVFCCCDKLATGLHERSCRKFNKKVDHATVKRMSKYLPK